MKVFRIVLMVFVMLAASLSTAKVAQAEWVLTGNAFSAIGSEYCNTYYGMSASEDLIELGGSIIYTTGSFNLGGVCLANRDRTVRVFYTWDGPGPVTSISYVPVSWFVSITGSESIPNYRYGFIENTGYTSSNSGSFNKVLTFTDSTHCYIDVRWGYTVSSTNYMGAIRSGIVSVGIGTGTPQ